MPEILSTEGKNKADERQLAETGNVRTSRRVGGLKAP